MINAEKRAAELRAVVDEAGASSGVVGAQVSVILDHDRLDFVYGSSNLELNLPMTADTVVQVGSVCKVFNAALIMTLVEEGRLALDTPVIEYIPDLLIADKVAQSVITLRHLLSMNSGLDNGPYNEHGRGEDALARYVASLHDVPQVFSPGQGFGYSNAGTSLAGYVAERVTGELWDSLIQKRIFEPAGLQHTVTLAEELPFHRVSVGHAKARNGQSAKVLRPWYITRAQGPAGSTLTMCAHDLATFGQIFINGGKAANGRRVLSEASVKIMMTPMTDVPIPASFAGVGQKWGFGPSMDLWGQTAVWGHGGGNRSGSSRFVWLPEKRGVLAVVVNTTDADEAFVTTILGDFSRAVFGVGAALPAAPASAIPLENPGRFVGCYERYGTRYEVMEDAGRLRFTEVSLGSGKHTEALGLVRDSALIPLGDDCFLVETTASGRDLTPPSQAVLGFFGADERNRAVNVATPVVTARRVG